MAMNLGSGRELKEREKEKKKIEEEKLIEIGEEIKQNGLEATKEKKTVKV